METNTTLKYNPDEAAQIAKHLADELPGLRYILLFGKLAAGTPHSDAAAYDLLAVTDHHPRHDWQHTAQLLRYKMPVRLREVTYINLYVLSLREVESRKTPLLHFAHSEGELLYCREDHPFHRPTRRMDFAAAYADAAHHFETFHTLGEKLLRHAHSEAGLAGDLRLAGLFAAQAAVCFYRTLYYVYHGCEFESLDLLILHERLRTLSARLMLALDNSHSERIFTLSHLKKYLDKAFCDPDFELNPAEVTEHLQRVQVLGGIVGQCCRDRLRLYDELREH